MVLESRSFLVELKKEIILSCCDSLEERGFVRYRKDRVDFPVNEKFHCWVGLNSGVYRDYVEISPFVGVHAVEIMRLYSSLMNLKYNRGIATYAVHMGELCPNESAFVFYGENDIENGSNRLANIYRLDGIKFCQSISTYEELLPLLRSRINRLGGYPERYACCLYLMGRAAEADLFVEEFLSSNERYFEKFAVAFFRFNTK